MYTYIFPPAIDLCYKCVQTVNDYRMPTKTGGGDDIRFISTSIGRQLMRDDPPRIVDVRGDILPMVAVTTLNGSRVCAVHTEGLENPIRRLPYPY